MSFTTKASKAQGKSFRGSQIHSASSDGSVSHHKPLRRMASIKGNISKIVQDPLFDKALETEESLMIAVSLREEIIDNAINNGYNKYVDQHKIKFLVQCLQTAYMQFIKLSCDDKGKSLTNFHWEQDSPPSPKLQDSWSEHSVVSIPPPEEAPVEQVVESVAHIDNVLTAKAAESELLPMQNESVESEEVESVSIVSKSMYFGYENDLSENSETPEMSFLTLLATASMGNLPVTNTRCVNELDEDVQASITDKSSVKINPGDFMMKLAPLKLSGKYRPEKIDKNAERKSKRNLRPTAI